MSSRVADFAQRGVVLTCVAVSIWGLGAIAQGHSLRMAKARDNAAKMAIDPSTIESFTPAPREPTLDSPPSLLREEIQQQIPQRKIFTK